jgi:hypothetical protein
MPEHYTKNTVSASFYCPKCGRETEHRIDGGRRGPCLVCLAKPSVPAKVKAAETQIEIGWEVKP